LGWEIEIRSAEDKKREVLGQIDKLEENAREAIPLSDLDGVGEAMRLRLEEAGISTVDELAGRSVDDLTEIPGVGEKTAEKLLAGAKNRLEGGAEATGNAETSTPSDVPSADESTSA
jgi:transcription termination factor NusA